jgi:hypothetical protein
VPAISPRNARMVGTLAPCLVEAPPDVVALPTLHDWIASLRSNDGGIASRSRGMNLSGSCTIITLEETEGAGNTGCWPHPRALRAKKMHFAHASNDRAAGTTGVPCAMALRRITRSPRCPGFFSHRRAAIRPAALDPGIGGSGPHAFAVRPRSARQAKRKRPSHPAPRVVTVAIRPPGEQRDGATIHRSHLLKKRIIFDAKA